ncbi:unnamed protein product [Urochloa humidicola]
MSGSLAVGRMLARRRPGGIYVDGAAPNTIAEKITSLGEEERALMSNHLAELDAELQSRLVQQVDAFFQRSTISDDRGIPNRVLAFCRVPKGEQRDSANVCSIMMSTSTRENRKKKQQHHLL